MQVEAIYEDGKLRFTQPLRLKQSRALVTVNIPDEMVEPDQQVAPEVDAAAKALLNRMRAIMDAPLPPEEELPPVTTRQEERARAFELRAEWRRQQGRPV